LKVSEPVFKWRRLAWNRRGQRTWAFGAWRRFGRRFERRDREDSLDQEAKASEAKTRSEWQFCLDPWRLERKAFLANPRQRWLLGTRARLGTGVVFPRLVVVERTTELGSKVLRIPQWSITCRGCQDEPWANDRPWLGMPPFPAVKIDACMRQKPHLLACLQVTPAV
jgi:hypothetical protein